MKKLLNRDFQSVTDFLYGGYGRTVIPSAYNIAQSRLCKPTNGSKLIYGYFLVFAQFNYPQFNRFTYVQYYYLPP